MSDSGRSDWLTLTLRADPAVVRVARSFIGAVAAEAGVGHDELEDMRLAVSEAVTNAVRATRRVGAEEAVVVRCAARPDEMVVQVQDAAGGFDPSVTATPTEELPASGYGIPVMHGLADDVSILAGAGGTRVSLTFRR